MSIALVATLTAPKGKRAELEQLFVKMREAVLANEKGCSYYEIFRSRENPDAVVLLEVYETQADLDAHSTTPHMQALGPQLPALFGAPPQVQFIDHI